jgi:hypothetical protein
MCGVLTGNRGEFTKFIDPNGTQTFPSHRLLPAGAEGGPCNSNAYPDATVDPVPCTSVYILPRIISIYHRNRKKSPARIPYYKNIDSALCCALEVKYNLVDAVCVVYFVKNVIARSGKRECFTTRKRQLAINSRAPGEPVGFVMLLAAVFGATRRSKLLLLGMRGMSGRVKVV